MILTILLSIIFGFLAGCLGAVCIEAYLQRRATDQVGDYDAPTYETGKRRAG